MDKVMIINGISALKNEFIEPKLNQVYSNIYAKVCSASPDNFANLFTSLESKAISDFYIHLEKKVREVAYDMMKKASVPEEDIPIIWIKARKNVPAPQARLCNQGGYTTVKSKNSTSQSMQSVSTQRDNSFGKWIVISGAVVEILSWIFIPSYSVWAPIVRGIGIVIIGAGAYKIYQEYKNVARIQLTDEAKKREQEKAQISFKDICSKQFSLNYKIYCEWIDNVALSVEKECSTY